ncbi:hypothetical protein CsatB_016211 [Cannabis sativa]|jgi:hypothetical protein|uniref:Uncharacterized protein n=2 Tax=Cannabis sativa TaxID=3483 RepID=A0A7J6GS44_CANSA|nr:hypothetical protein G4B88_026848 [Cannabis sativa]KAF4385190.1 hypothetical protein G4B88_026473 [Cannabis sativa]
MGSWRRKEHVESFNHGMRSQTRNQPTEIWQSTVPKWEKDFCYTVGSVPWRKVLDTKKYIHLHENIVKWNDSASEEAFRQAKNRFWAHINGLASEVVLPDPDIYIDEVDWNSEIDPELLLDLERKPEPSDYTNHDEKVLNLGNSHNLNQINLSLDHIAPTGWGDAEEDFKADTSSRERRQTWGTNGWKNNDDYAWQNSGYRKTRFSGNHYQQREYGYRGRRRQWNCAPVNNNQSGSGRGGNAWGLEKQIW